jgi:hypothetical protein
MKTTFGEYMAGRVDGNRWIVESYAELDDPVPWAATRLDIAATSYAPVGGGVGDLSDFEHRCLGISHRHPRCPRLCPRELLPPFVRDGIRWFGVAAAGFNVGTSASTTPPDTTSSMPARRGCFPSG